MKRFNNDPHALEKFIAIVTKDQNFQTISKYSVSRKIWEEEGFVTYDREAFIQHGPLPGWENIASFNLADFGYIKWYKTLKDFGPFRLAIMHLLGQSKMAFTVMNRT